MKRGTGSPRNANFNTSPDGQVISDVKKLKFWKFNIFKGNVSTAFVVWKYFSCIKKHLILCLDETKMDLKPLIMLF